MAYHVNPETGRPNLCRAQKQCPFGGAEEHFASKAEARSHFEREMSGQTLTTVSKRQARNIAAPSKYRLRTGGSTSAVDYEYDSYSCSDPYSCSESNDYCRDSVYEGLRVEAVTEEQVYDHVRSVIGANYGEQLPADLKTLVDSRMAEWTQADNWEAEAENGYYGEEAYVMPPPELESEVKHWFYSQPGAMDSDGILPYLRGAGFATEGKTPLRAVKDFLAEQNGGKRLPAVEAARSVELRRLGLKHVRVPNPQHYAKSEPRPLTPAVESGQKQAIAGVLLETKKGPERYDWRVGRIAELGEVQLVDGYHRLKELKENTKKNSGVYLILRK